MSAPRLLLVEFLSADRYSQYRSELYPFVQGWARAEGLAVRWLAFGYDPTTLPTNRYRMVLDPADTDRLTTAVRETRPTHVLLNEELDTPLQAAFDQALAAAGQPRWTVYGLGDEPRSFERRRTLAAWLGLAPPEPPDEVTDPTWLVDVTRPDYACELANDAARRIHPFVQVQGGPGCVYRRSLARNPAFADVDLSAAHRTGGCSFCGVGADTRYPYATRPVELALVQIRAALATCPPERCVVDGRVQFALAGAAAFMGIRPLLEAILTERLPPLELHLSCRIDELLRKAPAIEALLPALAAAGHRLAVANMGVENFSPAENERLNKGVAEADVAAVVALVGDWERRFPTAFRFWETGGFGFILFTPWTRTEDLRLNLRVAERLGLHPDSFFFVSRLQLMPGRPITLLARRDGLVVPPERAAELAGFDSGCILSAHEHELPWRFRHPEVAPVYGFYLRLRQVSARGIAPDVRPDDPDLRRIRALRARLPKEERSPWRLLPAVLDLADAHPDLRHVSDLLDRLEERLAPLLAPADAAAAGALAAAIEREEREATAPAPEQRESAADRERRAWLAARLAETLALLAGHPKRLLQGFVPGAVAERATGEGWGELRADLVRGETRIGLRILPRAVAPRGFVTTERFTLMHDEDTPVETEEKRRLLDVVARGLERYVRSREERAGAAPGSATGAAGPGAAP